MPPPPTSAREALPPLGGNSNAPASLSGHPHAGGHPLAGALPPLAGIPVPLAPPLGAPPSPSQTPGLHHAPNAASSQARLICTRCGGANASETMFCQFCGARLKPEEARDVWPSGPPAPALRGAAFEVQSPEPMRRPEVEPAATPAETPAVKRPSHPGPAPRAPLAGAAPDFARDAAPPSLRGGHGLGVLAPVGHISPSAPPAAPPGVEATSRYAPVGPDPASLEGPFSARLTVIAQDGSPGKEYSLLGEQSDIGREEGAIQLPNDPYVCPRHARIYRRNGRFTIRDLGSVNGVYVRLRRPETLQHGDLVLIGLEVLRFEVVADAEKGLGPAVERGTKVFGSPAAPRHARLLQRTVEGVTRDVFYLTRDEVVIGRESGDLVFTADPFMSRRHAAITRRASDGTCTVRDLGSSNGTYLAVRGEITLEPGDHVRIGQHLFRLDVDRK
jgi:pSer/pThr/pTyr-binding forkhead associated (FHA) protein